MRMHVKSCRKTTVLLRMAAGGYVRLHPRVETELLLLALGSWLLLLLLLLLLLPRRVPPSLLLGLLLAGRCGLVALHCKCWWWWCCACGRHVKNIHGLQGHRSRRCQRGA